MEIKYLYKIIQIRLEPTNPVLQVYILVHLTNVLVGNGSLKRTIYGYIWGIIFTCSTYYRVMFFCLFMYFTLSGWIYIMLLKIIFCINTQRMCTNANNIGKVNVEMQTKSDKVELLPNHFLSWNKWINVFSSS